MKITVINGCEKKGVTYRLKEIFLDEFRSDAQITEFYLPKDCPEFCVGCMNCFFNGEQQCKDAGYVQAIEKAMFEADLLVFAYPVYVYHTTGAMKSMLDHFGYRWMPHRPAAEMFSKRAVIITQCLGGGAGSAAKDVKDSLSWWGISNIRVCAFKLLNDVIWDNIPAKKRAVFTKKLIVTAEKVRKVDLTKPAKTAISTKFKFYACRMVQKSTGKKDPDSTDHNYWKEKGWLGSGRPWKAEKETAPDPEAETVSAAETTATENAAANTPAATANEETDA